MKPLFVLLITFGISLLVLYFMHHTWQWSMSGCIGMGVMMLFTAIAHFKFVKGMELMLPPFITFKKAVIILTGFIEIAAGIGLFFPDWQRTTGWWLILFFVIILPANISAALRHIDLEKGTTDGAGPAYLWFRIPLQLFFIAWVYFFAIRQWACP
jgi:uncharacterized membrane protein